MRPDAADDVHFAGLAVEAQRQALAAIHQSHRLGTHLALHAGDAFSLLRAQAEGPAQAVLGDHQRNLAGLLVGLVGGVDELHAVAGVEAARRLVVDVGEIGQRPLRVDRRRLGRRLPQGTLVRGRSCRLQPLHRFAAQPVGGRRRHEARFHPLDRQPAQFEVGVAEPADLLAQRRLGGFGLLRGLLIDRQRGGGGDAVFIFESQCVAGGGLGEVRPNADAALRRLAVEQGFPGVVAIAAYLNAGRGR